MSHHIATVGMSRSSEAIFVFLFHDNNSSKVTLLPALCSFWSVVLPSAHLGHCLQPKTLGDPKYWIPALLYFKMKSCRSIAGRVQAVLLEDGDASGTSIDLLLRSRGQPVVAMLNIAAHWERSASCRDLCRSSASACTDWGWLTAMQNIDWQTF